MKYVPKLSKSSCKKGPSPRHLRGRAKERSYTPAGSIHNMKQGELAVLNMLNLNKKAIYRAEIVCWVAESLRPYSIVEDRGFQSLMKTGHPKYYIPSRVTVSRDVHLIFACTRNWIAQMLSVSCSSINEEYKVIDLPEIQWQAQFYD